MEQMVQKRGFSFVEFLAKLWRNRLLVIIITILAAIAIVIPLYFLNKPNRLVKVGFEYNFLGVEANTYPDGSLFDFRSLLSIQMLDAVKQSDEKFGFIDVNELFLDEDSRIRRQDDEISSERERIISKNRYTLTIPFKYFDYDEDLAKEFIVTLLNGPIEYANQAYQSLHIVNNILLIDEDVEFHESISYYQNQYNLIIDSYQTFMEAYGNFSMNNVSINNQLTEFQDRFNKLNSLDELSLVIKQQKYVKNFEKFEVSSQLTINYIDERMELNALKIADLETMFTTLVATSNLQQAEELLSNIISLRLDNIEYNRYRTDLQDMLDFIQSQPGNTYASPSFLIMIDQFESVLNEYTSKYNEIQTWYYVNQTTLVYDDGSVVMIDGGFDNIVLALISGIFALSIAVAVVIIKEDFKGSKFEEILQRISNNTNGTE